MLKCQQLKPQGLVCVDEFVLALIEADFWCNFDRVHNREHLCEIILNFIYGV